jgi:peptide/nickel transport system substrate-binding protein
MEKQGRTQSSLSWRWNRRRLLGTAAAGGAGVALAACGGTRSGARPAQPSSGAAGGPRPGGRIAVHEATDPYNWDSSYAGKSSPNGDGMALAYDAVLGFKQGPEAKYGEIVVVPRLATSWENPDAVTYTFHLRPGLKFSPLPPLNGRDLTAADVKWSYEYWTRSGELAAKKLPQAQFDWFFEGMDSIQTPDPSTVVVHFKQPFVPFLSYAASDYNPVIPHEIFDQDGTFKDRIAGSGPFQLDTQASQKGTRWTWRKNPNYWDKGRPYLDTVDWLVVADVAAVIAAFRTKQLDWVGREILGYQQAAELKKNEPNSVEYSYMKPASEMYINQRQLPLSDVRVRQAIGFAIDRDEFVRVLDGGDGGWGMAGGFPDTFTQDETRQILRFDVQQAKQLLSAAGYANGIELELQYPGNDYGDTYIAAIQLLQSQLKRAGVSLALKSVDKNDFNNAKRVGKFDIILANKAALVGDVDSFLYAGFYSGSKANYGAVKDSKLDALLQAQRREVDPAKRQDIVRQAVRYINEQAYSLATDSRRSYEFWRPYVKDYAPQYGVGRVPLAETWIDK